MEGGGSMILLIINYNISMCIVYTAKTAIIKISNPLSLERIFNKKKTRKVETLPIISQYIYYVLIILHIDIILSLYRVLDVVYFNRYFRPIHVQCTYTRVSDNTRLESRPRTKPNPFPT